MFYDICLNNFFDLKGDNATYNNTLTSYSKKEIANYAGGKVNILYNNQDILRFIDNARRHVSNDKLYFGKINFSLSNKIKDDTDLDIYEFNVSLMGHAVNHIFKNHGNEKEMLRGQNYVKPQDFGLIPNIILFYDNILLGDKTIQNKNTLIFKKKINDSIYTLVANISDKRKTLEVKTFFINKAKRTLPQRLNI